jgi:hypothetical protein
VMLGNQCPERGDLVDLSHSCNPYPAALTRMLLAHFVSGHPGLPISAHAPAQPPSSVVPCGQKTFSPTGSYDGTPPGVSTDTS